MAENTALEGESTTSGNRSIKVRLEPHQVLFFNRQLSSMARLNMPLAKGVKILAKEVDDDNFRVLLESVQTDLEEGLPLSQALEKFPSSFSRLYLEVLRTGEASGNLDSILEQLTSYSESMMKIKRRITEALMYPAVIFSMILCFVIFFLYYVTPQTKSMIMEAAGPAVEGKDPFAGMMPITRWVFAISDLLHQPLAVILLLTAIVVSISWLVVTFRRMGDSYPDALLRLPIFGELFRQATLMKLTRTMRELLANGVSMVNTLRLSTNIVGDNAFKRKLKQLADAVEEGGSFSRNLASSDREGNQVVFPATMVWKLQMAEEKGIIEEALHELAHEFEGEVDSRTTIITKLLSPVLLIFMALVVFVLFVATFMPLTQLASMR